VTGRAHWLRVKNGPDNLIPFFEQVGYVYCDEKAVRGWFWAKYLRAYRAEATRRRTMALQLRDAGETYALIGKSIGVTSGAAHRLLSDIDAGKSVTAGHGFPHFADWIGLEAALAIPPLQTPRRQCSKCRFKSRLAPPRRGSLLRYAGRKAGSSACWRGSPSWRPFRACRRS
jgi:hypothetical protein